MPDAPLDTQQSLAKTVADLFRFRRTVGDPLAMGGLLNALRRRKGTSAETA